MGSSGEKGVEVRDLSHDQDSTDLEKCLQSAKAGVKVLGFLGCRVKGLWSPLPHARAQFLFPRQKKAWLGNGSGLGEIKASR